MDNNALTLEQFRATKKFVANFDTGNGECDAYVYAAGCFILIGGTEYNLPLCNEEYISADLAQLEAKLYSDWYLRECCYYGKH